jgi:hypothetical protein
MSHVNGAFGLAGPCLAVGSFLLVGACLIWNYIRGYMKRRDEQDYYQGLLRSLLDFQHARSSEYQP